MFYDYFDELPQVIDDDNQEVYLTISSIHQLKDNESLPTSLDITRRKEFIYLCSVCSRVVLVIDKQLEHQPQREEDSSLCIPDSDIQSSNIHIIKDNTCKGESLVVEDPSDSSMVEVRDLYCCRNCGSTIGYSLSDSNDLFVLNDSLSKEMQHTQFIQSLNRLLPLLKSKITKLTW